MKRTPLLLALAWCACAQAQHQVAATVAAIDFEFAGSGEPVSMYDYSGSAYGLTYSGAQLRASAVIGRQGPGKELIDVSGSARGAFQFARVHVGDTELGVPVSLSAGWRRVTSGQGDEPYGVSTFLMGAGGMVRHALSARTHLELHAIPAVGITGSARTDAIGLSWGADAGADWTTDAALGRVGLTVAYTFRFQIWNVNGSGVFSELVDEFLDYRGRMHIVALGIRF